MAKATKWTRGKYFCFQFSFFFRPFASLLLFPLVLHNNPHPSLLHSERTREKFKWKSQTKTHKMEIEKHYTSNCEKIVKCGWHFHPLNPNLLPPCFSLFFFSSPFHREFSYSSRYCWVSVIFKERLSIYINSIAALDIVREGFFMSALSTVGKAPNDTQSHAQF